MSVFNRDRDSAWYSEILDVTTAQTCVSIPLNRALRSRLAHFMLGLLCHNKSIQEKRLSEGTVATRKGQKGL